MHSNRPARGVTRAITALLAAASLAACADEAPTAAMTAVARVNSTVWMTTITT